MHREFSLPSKAKTAAIHCTQWALKYLLDALFRQIKSIIRFRLAFVPGLQTYYLKDFTKIYQLKCQESKNKCKTKSYERFNLNLRTYNTVFMRIVIYSYSLILVPQMN